MTISRFKTQPRPMGKVLIANRGEIACRIIRSLRAMKITSVALYSKSDAKARHVEEADEAYCVGPPPVAESYLNQENILALAHKCGADALHPGYGFLSENASFARAVDESGILFIGPPPDVIDLMGDKIKARASAHKAQMPLIPGSMDSLTFSQAKKKIHEIGLPAVVKAAAGGGGRGIRIVHDKSEIDQAITSAQNEAKVSFGDDRIYVERYIEQPRHIEVQILADLYGNVLHLGERECSVQRRHQKLLEESPSPALSEKTRQEITDHAVRLAQSVSYCSAGTIEMVMDPSEDCFFLEMNTRLQVEHTVTECRYHIDLVEWMIRIASGERLPFSQSDLKPQGHAIEARINAENPANSLPSTGVISYLHEPKHQGLRIDSGVYVGTNISPWYDSLICKVIAHAPNREQALSLLNTGMDGLVFNGIETNKFLLQSIVRSSPFQSGHFDTSFMSTHYPQGLTEAHCTPEQPHLFIMAAATLERKRRQHYWHEKSNFSCDALDVVFNQTVHRVTFGFDSDQREQAQYDKQSLRLLNTEPYLAKFLYKGTPVILSTSSQQNTWQIAGQHGFVVRARVFAPHEYLLSSRMKVFKPESQNNNVYAPMPALVAKIMVAVEDKVLVGTPLIALEAMKMENILTSPRDGIIEKIHVEKGVSVDANQQLITFQTSSE